MKSWQLLRPILRMKASRVRAIKERLLPFEDPIVVEVGANNFRHTKLFLAHFQQLTLHCFEPRPGAVELFERCIGRHEHCRFYNLAAGNEDGTATLSIAHNAGVRFPGASSIATTTDHSEQYPWLSFPESVTVDVVKLDTWAERSGVTRVDYLWTDVQGSERGLIEGGARLLQRTRFVQLEYGERGPYPETAMTREETIELLARHEFVLHSHFEQGQGSKGDLVFVNSRFA